MGRVRACFGGLLFVTFWALALGGTLWCLWKVFTAGC